MALCQVLGCDSLNHAPLLDLELFLYGSMSSVGV